MQARAAATAAEEQELRLVSEECDNYEALGLPPSKLEQIAKAIECHSNLEINIYYIMAILIVM